LHSDYPVQRIWQVNQPEYNGGQGVRLDEGAVALLARRQDHVIHLSVLSDAAFRLLQLFAQGYCLGYAVMQIPQQECASALQAAFALGSLSAYSIGDIGKS